MNKLISTIILLAVLSLCSCAKPEQQLVGNWIPSISETKKLNESFFKSNPFAELGLMVIGSMRLNFTRDQITLEMGGEKSTKNFKVVSSSSGDIKIKCDGDKSDKTIKILNSNTLVLPKDNNDGFDIVFEKIK